MPQKKSKLQSSVAFVLALSGAFMFIPRISEANTPAAPPFAGLSGKWSGDGSIALTNGTTERLRCDSTDAVGGGGDNLDMKLRCASDSYNFDLSVSLVDTAGQIVGNWNELTKSVQGGITGKESKGLIQVIVRGQAFTANVTVATRGSEQSVKIRSQSGDLSRVTIALHRAR
jgi:hypothetical protein